MIYNIRREMAAEDTVRATLPERAYVRGLIDDGDAIEIDNVVVDARELIERRFICDTLHCLRVKKNDRLRGSCCTDLEVNLTPNEIQHLKDVAERYLDSPAAQTGGMAGQIARRIIEGDKVIDINHLGEKRLTHNKKKVCSLGFIDDDGRLLCALNAFADGIGEELPLVKLPTCYLFPLHYVEYEKGRFLLTLISEANYESLEGAYEVARLRCARKPPKDAPRAYESLRGEIEFTLGKSFYRRMLKAIEEWKSGRKPE